MNKFIAKFEPHICGVLSGFDRLMFRGTLRALCGLPGMESYLAANRVLYKDFGDHVEQVTQTLKEACLSRANREKRPIQYVGSSSVSKEELARSIAAEQKVRQGLICVITSIEPCKTFDIYRNRSTRHLDLIQRERKCLHLYQYWMHPVWGLMHGRIQSWFPFSIQVYVNGREWLARTMDRRGWEYLRQGNCFPWVEDFERAQQLLTRQLKSDWPSLLDGVARELNPAHPQIFRKFQIGYYWSVFQSEWATDVVFEQQKTLRQLYPKLVHHGITTFGSSDVLRFLGRKLPASGNVRRSFQGEVLSDIQERPEGIRLKHGVNRNTVKVYDKAFTPEGSVLRFETTICNVEDWRVYRPKEGDPEGALQWRPLRRGIADLHRRAEVSQQANDRYMDALASVDDSATLLELTQRLEQPTLWRNKRVRGLRLFDREDRRLLQAVSRGEFTIRGLRNRDLQALLFVGPATSATDARRRSAWVSRKLRLLRAHHLLQKVPHTHRYHVTKVGRKILTAILTAARATIAQLTALAA